MKWLPCSHRARRFVPLHLCPVSTKSKQKPCLKYYKSSEHSIKAYADDATLISDCLETHTKVLQQVDQKALCVSFLFGGNNHSDQGIELSGVLLNQSLRRALSF